MKIKKTLALDFSMEKDEFLATMSHELRTPLNGIMGMVTMLSDAGSLNTKQQTYVKNLIECTMKLTSLLNNILDFSKMASNCLVLRKEPLNIENCIKSAVQIVDHEIKNKKLDLEINIEKKLPSFMGDKQRLIQILNNLLSNSVKFTEKGGITINVKAERMKSTVSYRKLWKIVFDVADTGIGIPIKEQKRIFDTFSQSSNLNGYLAKSGTGLGLSIVKELTKLMGGKISLQSSGIKGEGSIFSFFITLDQDINIGKLKKSYSDLLRNTNILVVDDREEIRIQIANLLLKWGCNPRVVPSAKEALEYLKFNINYETIIIDICMPHMSGIELAQEIRSVSPGLPLIGISSMELKNGEKYFDCYMNKPIDQNVLFHNLIKCLKCKNNNQSITKKKRKDQLKILIAEDDHCNSFTMKEILYNKGYVKKNVFVANNGSQAVDITKKEDIDVILMDIRMPVMNGVEASRIIKKFENPPSIIIVSACVQNKDKDICQSIGIDGYLTKPIDKDKLYSILQSFTSSENKKSRRRKTIIKNNNGKSHKSRRKRKF